MVWSEKNNIKWTTKFAKEKGWKFFDTEVAFPTRSHCHKHRTVPDLFITIHNVNLGNNEKPPVDQAITIHLRTNIISLEKLKVIEKSIYQIGALLHWKIAGKIKRPTAYKSELGIGYTDSFWDGIFGVLSPDDQGFSDSYKRYGIEVIKEFNG